MTQTLTDLAERAVARLALALLLALALRTVPTFAHSLWTEGPLSAISDTVEVLRWILSDLRPNGSF